MRVNALVVSAGEGTRMGGGVSKLLLEVDGKPLILHTLERLQRARQIRRVVLVVAQPLLSDYRELLGSTSQLTQALQISLCAGGERRQDSVRAGLGSLDTDCELVVIHDGARPFIDPNLVDRCVSDALTGDSVCVAVPARNTIKRAVNGLVQETLPRHVLWEVQTPQVFPVSILEEAYALADRDGFEATDDASLVERLGKPVRILEGNTTNIKVTYPEDVAIAEALLASGKV